MQHVFGPCVDTDILDGQQTQLGSVVVAAEHCERSNFARQRHPEYHNFWPPAIPNTIRMREQTSFHFERGKFFRFHIEHGY